MRYTILPDVVLSRNIWGPTPIVKFFTTKNFTINDTKPLVLGKIFC